MNQRPTTLLVLTSLALALAACGPKEETSTGAPAEATRSASFGDQVLDDKASKAFAERLVEIDMGGFRPIDSAGAELQYDTVEFGKDGSFMATGAVSIADEKMECKEVGSWAMEPAEEASTGLVNVNIEKTSCAGREPTELRLRLTIQKSGTYKVDFR